ncbi:MarR family transcriptional regulator [Corynebacterium sp. ES2794-CONJ1]|uniref:MarR family winged helix-turn-helix transcriptional regulator n=1 Tax=unclassified Corynebacterium TaxID=2624378 RepID=UPI002167CEB5|nr:MULTISPECIES: MarR family transcriptional regulator [unclassified Corynebacterium]MCS4490398.1 MarR family transcriptional regulator [Corynebacterium sp. ES2775-CONJ]MCS4492179.1 MarR family transcriptional regulator [Corynebacterium sp. ES2715-CONJ3]MCS4532340.1 MarR family transcriptional regulator [Corynebacterium sp. ES2730-CONJ]MCU9519697.1 MarR family transcriptional regulator [Corynebacterium sp. ES2794-CONJ1]
MSAQEKLQSDICFQFYTGARLLQRSYRPYLETWGITYVQYLVLQCLWEKDGQTIAAIGALVDLDSGTLSPLLKRLEKAGWVQRAVDETDYRRVIFSLTPKAQKLEGEAEDMRSQVESMIGLNNEDMAAIHKIMDKIRP